MRQSNKRYIQLRYLLVVGMMLFFSMFIVWAMFKNSVIYAGKWNAKADSVLLKITDIPPERGKLLADDGNVLAANLQFYTVRIDWLAAGIRDSVLKANLPALSDSLAAFDPSRSAQEWSEELYGAYKRITDPTAKRKNHAYRVFKRMISHSEYERVRKFPFFCLPPNKSGFYSERESKRCKPYGSMASRSIGSVGKSEKRSGLHGQSGLEGALDSLLYGTPGKAKRIQLTTNIVNAESVPPKKGYDITTTINIELQDILENELYDMCRETSSKWGTAILMEVETGEIKAISNLMWNDNANDYIEGLNNAVLGYEPGSVMKPITMMMALELGAVKNIDEPMVTGTRFEYCGSVTTDPHGGGSLTPREIIATSSNVGMSRIALRMFEKNPDGFRSKLAEMGFFDPINSGIAGERVPRFPKLGNKPWERVALTRMAFGYSTEIPPLYTLAMYNAIANDGKFVRPHLVKKLSREGEPDSIVPVDYIRQQVCSPENAQKLRIMLHDVVWSDRGTAHRYLQDKNVNLAGKTGTAYTIQDGAYNTGERRLAFCGFFPYEKPKYSCIVLMLGADRGAAASSGVVLKNVALKMYARGLLGDPPRYDMVAAKDGTLTPATPSAPTLFATASDSHGHVRRGLGLASTKTFQQPSTVKQGVPDVKGLGVREAIKRLEDAGLCVTFAGHGCVVAQSIAPGTAYRRGESIKLQLRN